MFSEEKHFNVINGEVQDPGDIYFAYYVDDNITREMPKKGSGYTLDTEKSNCTNGVVPTWDNGSWKFIGDYSGYNATDYTRTRCNLYFKKIDITAVEYIKELAKYDTEMLDTDEVGGNIRYIGSSPNNYVSIDGELWRIIGVMKNIDDGTGNKSDRVKLIRASSIGEYSWDNSTSSVNGGYGVNEWSKSTLMKLLNPGYESESIGGSLYWNNQSGKCYLLYTSMTTSCDFTSTGINEKLKTMISAVVWNTGAATSKTQIVNRLYEEERGNKNGKICSSGNYCNDTVERTTTWTGKVGLAYPSDYGYATSGGSTTDRTTCLNTNLNSWDSNVNDCKDNNWLFNQKNWWLMSPYGNEIFATLVLYGKSSGIVDADNSYDTWNVFPVVYLSSNVLITLGDGSESNPYTLSV